MPRRVVFHEFGGPDVLRIEETAPPQAGPGQVRVRIRYAGLNLRERQSGMYRGKTKISKKGRPLLRKILGQAVMLLVRKDALYGDYYHRKKEEEKVCGRKIMTNVSRKFLKMLYGWYKSGDEFDVNRIFQCESEFKSAA